MYAALFLMLVTLYVHLHILTSTITTIGHYNIEKKKKMEKQAIFDVIPPRPVLIYL